MSTSPLHLQALSAPERPAWRRALDARIDRWMARPELYRRALALPLSLIHI